MTQVNQPEIAPTQPGQRIQTIDILRGFALFGILLVNMEFFNNSVQAYIMGLAKPAELLNQLGRWFIAFFGEGKFYSTFAFLFGLGMSIQMGKAQEKGARFVPFFIRRMVVLLLIGLVHAYLFWMGDILILYSVLGTIMVVFFRKCQLKTLLIWVVICLIIPLLINGFLWGLTELSRSTPEGAEIMAQMFSEMTRNYQAAAENANRIYATGTFAEITRQRISDMNVMYSIYPFMAFNVLAMLLLGLAVGKKRIQINISENLPFIRKVLLWGFIVGVTGNLVYVVVGENVSRFIPSASLMIHLTGQTFGAPALAMFYMAGLTLLAQKPAWQKRLNPLAYTGRMAISNYLLQTIICTLLFYGYGFGLYGRIGAAGGILLTALIFALQIPFSMWWLKRFRFGPVEWLWRSLTYGKIQPMKI